MDIVVVLGTLGSGKTTLVNALLPLIQDRRTLVVVNDVGTVNVDAQRISKVGDVRALTAGCIGCSDLPAFQQVITEARDSNSVDLLLIEPTGIADGKEIRDAVAGLELACSVMTLLDVTHFARNRAMHTMESQLRVASLVLISWVPPGMTLETLPPTIVRYLAEHAPGVRVELFPSGAEDILRVANQAVADQQHHHATSHHQHHHHNHGVSAYSLQFAPQVTLDDVLRAIAPIRASLLRAKGVVGGLSFDFVQADLRTHPEPDISPYGTFISTEKLPEALQELALVTTEDQRTKKERMRDDTGIPLADTIDAITWQLGQYPPIHGPNGLRVDCEADICYQLSRRPHVPLEVQAAVLEKYLSWRIAVARELDRQELFTVGTESMVTTHAPTSIACSVWDSHPDSGYWRRRLGVNLLYMPAVHDGLINRDTMAAILETRPAEIFVKGLLVLKELSCNDEMAEERPDIIELCFKWAITKGLLSRRDALAVIDHCRVLSLETPWKGRWATVAI